MGTKNSYADEIPILPPPLKKNSRVALVSPAGPATAEELERSADNARSLGWEPVTGQHAGKKHFGYLAGEDAQRLEDLNDAFRDSNVDGIWCVRGGYGAMRLIEQLDYDALRKNPKTIIGFSDITALHSAIYIKTGLVTFHGPTAREKHTEFSRVSLMKAVAERVDPCGVAADGREVVSGRAEGRLAGGNLSTLVALVGTPYATPLDGAILILEDVNETLYRVDRMLHQLLLAGCFTGCRGIAFGDFTGAEEEGKTEGLDALIGMFAQQQKIPCLGGIPVGHITEQWTIPFGATATLDTSKCSINVSFKEAAR